MNVTLTDRNEATQERKPSTHRYVHVKEFHDIINQLQTKYPNRLATGIISGFLYIGYGNREIRIQDSSPLPSLHDIEVRLGL